MPKIIILPLSIYIDNQPQQTEIAFRRLGVGRLALFWHYLPLPAFLEKIRGPSLPTIFDKYRRGELNTEAFRREVRNRFPKAHLGNNDAFDDAWNAMQGITKVTIEAFNEAQTLVDQGYIVYLLAGTNPLHIQDIKHKTNLPELPGISYLSYEQKQLGREHFTSLLRKIRIDHKDITRNDIAFFYTPPKDPYPQLGKFAWLNPLAIVKNFEYLQAKKYVMNLKKEATTQNGFTLISCQPKVDQRANIIQKIAELGWRKDPNEREKRQPLPSITHLRDAKSGSLEVTESLHAKTVEFKESKQKKFLIS